MWAPVDDEEVVAAGGARVIWLAPYLPYMSPAERCRSKIKQLFRAAKARTREGMEQALIRAMKLVTSCNICGYPGAPD